MHLFSVDSQWSVDDFKYFIFCSGPEISKNAAFSSRCIVIIFMSILWSDLSTKKFAKLSASLFKDEDGRMLSMVFDVRVLVML